MEADRHNGILMSILLIVAETTITVSNVQYHILQCKSARKYKNNTLYNSLSTTNAISGLEDNIISC